MVVSAYNNWDDPAAMSLIWLENNGRQQFAMHRIASSPTHLITLATGDLDGDGTVDLVPAACISAARPTGRHVSFFGAIVVHRRESDGGSEDPPHTF